MSAVVEPIIVTVLMPEKGVFQVRCREDFAWATLARGTRVVVQLDYGLDVGVVKAVEPYDSAIHGSRPPGFRLERIVTTEDETIEQENVARAQAMVTDLEQFVRAEGREVHVVVARLALGRNRLFVRYTAPEGRVNLNAAVDKVHTQYKVSVQAWQMGPRDEVAALGAVGSCGRICCCASWQTRFPTHIPALTGGSGLAANGMCGRYKCCWAFEAKN